MTFLHKVLHGLLRRMAEPAQRVINKSCGCKPVCRKRAAGDGALPVEQKGELFVWNTGNLFSGRECKPQIQKAQSFVDVLPWHEASNGVTLVRCQTLQDTLEVSCRELQKVNFRCTKNRESKIARPLNVQNLAGLCKLRHPCLRRKLVLLKH